MPQAILAISALWLAAEPARASLPRTDAETATGKDIVLPDSVAGRVAVLSVGFTKSSASTVREWDRKLAAEYRGDARVVVLRVALLEAVPGLLRGLVRSKVKGQAAPERQASFLLLWKGTDLWKRATGFDPSKEDDAYLVVLDQRGAIALHARGQALAVQQATDAGPSILETVEATVGGLIRKDMAPQPR